MRRVPECSGTRPFGGELGPVFHRDPCFSTAPGYEWHRARVRGAPNAGTARTELSEPGTERGYRTHPARVRHAPNDRAESELRLEFQRFGTSTKTGSPIRSPLSSPLNQ